MHMHTFTHAHTCFTRVSDEFFHHTNVLGVKKSNKRLFDAKLLSMLPIQE